MKRATVVCCAAALLISCDRPAADSSGRTVSSSTTDSPRGVVDSIFPPEEMLRRFRVGLADPGRLHGEATRDALVRRFITAVERKNAATLESLAIDRAEFGYVVFPELKESRPPYRQPPEIAWLMLRTNSDAGLSKLVNQAADRFSLLGYRCAAPPDTEGSLRLYRGCEVRVRETGAERYLRLFGAIVERGGRWKFAGYSGDL